MRVLQFDRLSEAGRSMLVRYRLSHESWMAKMPKRMSLPRGKSRRIFSRHAKKTHSKNVPAPRKMPMRGGIRM